MGHRPMLKGIFETHPFKKVYGSEKVKRKKACPVFYIGEALRWVAYLFPTPLTHFQKKIDRLRRFFLKYKRKKRGGFAPRFFLKDKG